jgi:ectoine hydroxylase
MQVKNSLQNILLSDYKKSGFALFDHFYHPAELPDFDFLIDEQTEKFYEKDGISLRSIYGFQQNAYFRQWLTSQQRIKEVVTSLLGEEVYLHQTKVNIKNRDESSVWPYHRDFPFWHVFDHIPVNQMLNLVIFLDDVPEGSGEMALIPGSQHEYLQRESNNIKVEYSLDGSASNDLLFDFTEEEVLYFKEKYGLEYARGMKGSLLLFNPDVIHGSGKSERDFSRKIMILTFNRCDNQPHTKSKRPAYLCATDTAPIKWS